MRCNSNLRQFIQRCGVLTARMNRAEPILLHVTMSSLPSTVMWRRNENQGNCRFILDVAKARTLCTVHSVCSPPTVFDQTHLNEPCGSVYFVYIFWVLSLNALSLLTSSSFMLLLRSVLLLFLFACEFLKLVNIGRRASINRWNSTHSTSGNWIGLKLEWNRC